MQFDSNESPSVYDPSLQGVRSHTRIKTNAVWAAPTQATTYYDAKTSHNSPLQPTHTHAGEIPERGRRRKPTPEEDKLEYDGKLISSMYINSPTGGKIFLCPICDKKCARRQHLIAHIRIHTGEKPLRCTYCDKDFAYPASLKIHLRTHTGERPYKCGICNANFAADSSLRNHAERTHSGRRFQCSFCDATFACVALMRAHKKNIHNNITNKSHRCFLCSAYFYRICDVRKHVKYQHGRGSDSTDLETQPEAKPDPVFITKYMYSDYGGYGSGSEHTQPATPLPVFND